MKYPDRDIPYSSRVPSFQEYRLVIRPNIIEVHPQNQSEIYEVHRVFGPDSRATNVGKCHPFEMDSKLGALHLLNDSLDPSKKVGIEVDLDNGTSRIIKGDPQNAGK